MVVGPESKGKGNENLSSLPTKLGNQYVCFVDNVDPGANLAKTVRHTREAAELEVLGKARPLVGKTRRFN